MKTIISKALFIIYVLWAGVGQSQSDDYRLDYSPYGQPYKILSANMAALASHGKLTQFTFFDMNFVNTRFQSFLIRQMGFSLSGDGDYEMMKPNKYVIETYEKSFRADGTPKRLLKVKYNVFIENNNLIIKSCEISGYWEYIADIYLMYWNTTLDFEGAKKGEIVVNRLLEDKVVLSLNLVNKTGKITITSSAGQTIDQYRERIKNITQPEEKN